MGVFKFGKRKKSVLSDSFPLSPDGLSPNGVALGQGTNPADDSVVSIAVSTQGPSLLLLPPPPPTHAAALKSEAEGCASSSQDGDGGSHLDDGTANPSNRQAPRASVARRKISSESVAKWWRQVKYVGKCLRNIGDDLDRSSLSSEGSCPPPLSDR